MDINRRLESLHPIFKRHLSILLETCRANGLNIYLFEGMRSFDRQAKLYMQGRAIPGKIVTQAKPGYSLHNYGLAADLVFNTGPSDKNWSWDGPYSELGPLVALYPKLEWAGNWLRFKESPHIQLRINYSIDYLKRKFDRGGIEEVWKLVR